MATDLLVLDHLNVYYGESHVLHDVSWGLKPGRLIALLGRNGAGKTTTIGAIVGFLKAKSGAVRFDGQEIQNTAPEAISRAGVALVPQGRRIFGSLTVRENLEVAANKNPAGDGRIWTREEVSNIFPRLKERQNQVASSLSGGELQMLAIGRALMTSPRLLLLDEPSEGLAPQIVREVQQILIELKKEVSIVLVEQNLSLAMSLADDVVLMDTGKIVFTGAREAFEEKSEQLRVHLGVH